MYWCYLWRGFVYRTRAQWWSMVLSLKSFVVPLWYTMMMGMDGDDTDGLSVQKIRERSVLLKMVQFALEAIWSRRTQCINNRRYDDKILVFSSSLSLSLSLSLSFSHTYLINGYFKCKVRKRSSLHFIQYTMKSKSFKQICVI